MHRRGDGPTRGNYSGLPTVSPHYNCCVRQGSDSAIGPRCGPVHHSGRWRDNGSSADTGRAVVQKPGRANGLRPPARIPRPATQLLPQSPTSRRTHIRRAWLESCLATFLEVPRGCGAACCRRAVTGITTCRSTATPSRHGGAAQGGLATWTVRSAATRCHLSMWTARGVSAWAPARTALAHQHHHRRGRHRLTIRQ
jgi:hypothetical protein